MFLGDEIFVCRWISMCFHRSCATCQKQIRVKLRENKKFLHRNSFVFALSRLILFVGVCLWFSSKIDWNITTSFHREFLRFSFSLLLRNSINFSKSLICVRIWLIKFSLSFTGLVNWNRKEIESNFWEERRDRWPPDGSLDQLIFSTLRLWKKFEEINGTISMNWKQKRTKVWKRRHRRVADRVSFVIDRWESVVFPWWPMLAPLPTNLKRLRNVPIRRVFVLIRR